jgi:signal transduction histidine kinase/ActR/RegA family two-component response regulator
MVTPGRGIIRCVAFALMAALVVALLLVSALYANHLAVGSLSVPALVVYDSLLFAASILCALRAVAVRRERLAWGLMACALFSWTAGEIYWDCVFGALNSPPIPSISDAFWLAFYPFAAASLVLLARSRLRNVSAAMWLDGVTGALGVSAVSAAVIFDTVLRNTRGRLAVVATGLAYPVGDLVLLATLVLVSIASGPRLFRQSWLPMVAGLVVFYVADSAYLVQSATNTYHQYGLLDIGWPLGLVLVSFAAWTPFRRNPERVREPSGVATPVAFGMLGLGVLVVDHFRPTNLLAMALAVGCIVSVGVGLVFSFRYRKAAYDSAIARDEAIDASNAKSMFVATVSHELRTPLNGVIGMTELLLDTELTGQQREYADIVRSSSDGLLAIINEILDYSKIEAGNVDVVTVDFALREAIAEACAMLLVAARAKGIELIVVTDPGMPTWLHGDASRIRQVVVNLVSNAVKFTSEGRVTVYVKATPVESATRVRVEVADTGIGIREEALAQLFEPFTQADTSNAREYGGTGLGLAISARLIKAMGGTIGVHSQPGQGSQAWFELVLSAAARAQPCTPPNRNLGSRSLALPPSDASPVVLVAEDNPINQHVAIAMLAKCGYRAEAVHDGRAALDAIARTTYAAVLMDCQMPVMDGYEATREIRRNEYDDAHLPIIAMTAHSADNAEEECRDAGMDGYMTKPMREQTLREALDRAIPEGARLVGRRFE